MFCTLDEIEIRLKDRLQFDADKQACKLGKRDLTNFLRNQWTDRSKELSRILQNPDSCCSANSYGLTIDANRADLPRISTKGEIARTA